MNLGLKLTVALLVGCSAAVSSAQKVSKISFPTNSVAGGAPSTGTVEISSAAGSTGAVVSLTSSNGGAVVPVSVTVPTGKTSATFTVSTIPVATVAAAVIKATLGTSSATATLKVEPPKVTELTFSPTSVQGGSTSTGNLKISSAAPTGGIKVTFTSTSTNWGGPSSIIVSAGATSASFPVTTVPIGSTADATVTAELSGEKVSGILTINAPLLAAFNLSSTSIVGGTSTTGVLTLDGPAPKAGYKITLSSKSPSVTVPGSVSVPAGETSITFAVTTKSVATKTTAIVIASAPASSVELALTLNAVSLTRFSISSSSAPGGTSVTGTLTLDGVAPSGGIQITLSSNQSAVKVPATVTIPAGATSATFAIATTSVPSGETATITAASQGGDVQSASLALTSSSAAKRPPATKSPQ